MTAKMLEMIRAAFPTSELDCSEFSVQKHSGMKFKIRAFHAEGLGHVSLMTAFGFFGLMKMDTLIINPFECDMPLFSYDRVLAMGNDTLIFELYDTFTGEGSVSPLSDVKKSLDFPEHDLGAHWYDSIKLPESVSKKGKKQNRAAFDTFVEDYTGAFLKIAATAPACASSQKKEKASVYVEGLLQNGGPSTDVFLKGIGREKTEELFRKVLFGTGR